MKGNNSVCKELIMRFLINRWKRGCLLLLAMAVMMTSAVSVQAAVSGGGHTQGSSGTYRNMVAVARKNKLPKGKWVKSSRGIRYQKKTGGFLKNKWYSAGNKVYCFDRSGYVQTGSFYYNGKKYYADSKGAVK